MPNCRIYNGDIDDRYKKLLYEGELNIEKLKELEETCYNKSREYCIFVPAYHITEDNIIEFYTSGAWEC